MNDVTPTQPLHEAKQRRHIFSPVWIIPLLAIFIAGYLAVRSYSQHGPVITISFRSAEGLVVGQTTVKYKYVPLGTVEDIALKDDLSGVFVRVRMTAQAASILNDHTRFWVERPRLSSAALTDIVSGTYIQMDPGTPGGTHQTDFVGLEDQPSLPADEPGTTYSLTTARMGPVMEGSPVFYRDINVGKVLGYDVGDGTGPVTVHVFVREPYNKFVKPDTHFWNASGLSVRMGGGALHIEMQSLLSIINGGIAFDTPVQAIQEQQADPKVVFQLYPERKLAEAAASNKGLPFVTYMKSSIKDLAVGSPVQIFGIDVGEVTDVSLALNRQDDGSQVRVGFVIDPQRALGGQKSDDDKALLRDLVQKGMRVNMQSSNLIMGQEILSLEFAPQAEHADVVSEGDALVLPGQGGGIENIAGALSDIAAKLDQIPFDMIGEHLNHLMASADKTFGGVEMQQAMHNLAVTLANAQEVSQQAKQNLTPAMQKLPDISNQLQQAVAHANAFINSVDQGYGQDSDFQRDTKRVLDESSEAARSIRLLADYLDRHPEALIEGKKPEKGKP